jgi:hypothetical protein
MALIFASASCSEDFLEKTPETSISPKDFFKTASDLEAYTNGFYDDGALLDKAPYTAWDGSAAMADFDSDNTSYWRDHNYLIYLGTVSPQNSPGKYSSNWGGWGSLRRVNVMLSSVGNMGNIIPADRDHFLGIARYFRAKFYIAKIREYSDVIWYSKVLESNDPDLYKTQDPRAAVVDSVMLDLEFAAASVKEAQGNRTRVNRFVALAELSRFALYEGTYRKYHPELNLASTANRFLERAASAADEIIRSGRFGLATGGTGEVEPNTGIIGCRAFRELFSSLSLNDNPEILMWIDYSKTIDRPRNRMGNLMLPATHHAYSLSRALMENFLTSDGYPFSTVPNYARLSFFDVFANRDPRLAETFAYPGAHMVNPDKPCPMMPHSGGYDQIKYFPESYDEQSSDNNGGWTGIPLYRYAEVLLNYAEAKAELGKLTADDIARSINPLRARVGMPDFNAARETDADLRAQYPTVSDNSILAVRRERRSELAGEGLRKWDIFRWGAGKLHVSQKALQGIYIPQLPYVYDSNADGEDDAGLVAKRADIDALPADVKAKADNWDSLEGLELYLDDGSSTPDPNRTRTSGHIRKSGDNDRKFIEPKYYYRPIPVGQVVLNPQLKQPFGW